MSDPATNRREGSSLSDLASRIKTEHAAVLEATRSVVRRAMTAGELLNEAKGKVDHGQWLPWLKDNCDLPERTAQLYMKLAAGRAKLIKELETKSATIADLTLKEALQLIEEEPATASDTGSSGSTATTSVEPRSTTNNASDKVDKLEDRLIEALKKLNPETAKAAAAKIIQRFQDAGFLDRGKKAA